MPEQQHNGKASAAGDAGIAGRFSWRAEPPPVAEALRELCPDSRKSPLAARRGAYIDELAAGQRLEQDGPGCERALVRPGQELGDHVVDIAARGRAA